MADKPFPAAAVQSITACDCDAHCQKILTSLKEECCAGTGTEPNTAQRK